MAASPLQQRRCAQLFRHGGSLSILGLLGLLTACGDPAKGPNRGSAAAPVIVAQVERKTVPVILDAIGSVEPSRTASVRSQVTGTLLKIDFQEGQEVTAGDLLFEIDPRPFQNALRSAEADLQKNRVQLENAQSQSARYRALGLTQAISQEQLRTIEDAERSAAAQVLAGEAAVASARLQLDYCSIRAPIAGQTGSYGAHVGDLISASSSTPLVVVHQISPTYVTFGVPQQYLGEITRYRAVGPIGVAATPPGTDPTPEQGQLSFLDNNVDATTGTLRLKATFPNSTRRLWPGQFVATRITLATPEAIVVPTSAVQNDQSGQHVFVVKTGNIAEVRPVKIERRNGPDAVVASGLAVGETVVVDGQLRVVSGRPVEIKTPGPTHPAAAKPKSAP